MRSKKKKPPKCQTFSMSEEWFLFSRFSPENDAVTGSPSRLLIQDIAILSSIIIIIIIMITLIFIWKKKYTACLGKLKLNGNSVYFQEWSVCRCIKLSKVNIQLKIRIE